MRGLSRKIMHKVQPVGVEGASPKYGGIAKTAFQNVVTTQLVEVDRQLLVYHYALGSVFMV